MLAIVMVLAGARPAWAQTATLTAAWDANPDPAVTGYVLQYGTEPGVYTESIDVGNVTSRTITVPTGYTYYFVVKAYITSDTLSDPSAMASGGVFTDRPLAAGVTAVKAAHLNELRSRINAARVVRGLAAYPWLEPAAASGLIKAQHITELRAALTATFTAEPSLTTPTFATDAVLLPGATIKAAHFTELRSYVEQLEATP